MPHIKVPEYANRAIDGGLDIGNTLWLVFGQLQEGHKYRVLKEMLTLPPRYIRELAGDFIEFYKPHRIKQLKLYYDRATNNLP